MRLLHILLITLLLAASAFGSDYYVATTGNDSAVGSEVAPWQTIARVLPDYSGEGTAVVQGDTVIFAAGSYGQFSYRDDGGTGRTGYITYQGADSEDRPIFTNLVIYRTQEAYLKFDNIEFRSDASNTSAILLNGLVNDATTHVTYVQIINSYINSQPGDTGDHGYAGINASYATNVTVDNCTIEKNGYGFLASNVDGITISDCNIHLSYLDAVHLVDVCDVVVEDSLIHNVQWRTQSGAVHRDAIQIYANVGEICDNVVIRRNKIYECEAQATNIVSTNDNQLTNFTWENNLFYGRFGDAPGYNMAEPYQVGTVTVTNGSAAVTGAGTSWDSGWTGSHYYLKAENASTQVMVESFDDATNLTLVSNWGGDTGSDQQYAIYVTYNLFNVEGTNLTVRNNTFATRFSGQGWATDQVFNLVMYNNIFAGTTYSYPWSEKAVTWKVDPCSMSGFNNNIFGDYNPTGWALDDLSTAGDGLATANTELGQNGEDAAVGFVDADNYDFRLALGSTAIDRGDSVYAPIFDIQGNIRSTSPEAGAYEYGAEIRYLLARILE